MRRLLAAAALFVTIGCGSTSPKFGGAGDKAVRVPDWDLVIDIAPMRIGSNNFTNFEASFPGGVGDATLTVQIYQRSDNLEMIVEQKRAALAENPENTVREAEATKVLGLDGKTFEWLRQSASPRFFSPNWFVFARVGNCTVHVAGSSGKDTTHEESLRMRDQVLASLHTISGGPLAAKRCK